MSTVYEVTATRDGRWWLARIPDVDDDPVRTRTAREIPEVAAAVLQAALGLDEPPEVSVTLQLPEPAAAAWREADDLRRRATADEQRAGVLRRAVVRQLLADGWSQTDASAALRLSYQRVQQLARPDDRP